MYNYSSANGKNYFMEMAEEVNVGDIQDWNACRSKKFDMVSFFAYITEAQNQFRWEKTFKFKSNC